MGRLAEMQEKYPKGMQGVGGKSAPRGMNGVGGKSRFDKAAKRRAAAIRFEKNRSPATGNTPLGTTEMGRSLMRVNTAKAVVEKHQKEPSKEPEFKIEGMFA